MFAEDVERESVADFLSRLISDQNQLLARAAVTGGARPRLAAAFEAGLGETRELVADLGTETASTIDRVADAFARRLAELDS